MADDGVIEEEFPEVNPPEELVRVTGVTCPRCRSPYHYYCFPEADDG